jgi:microcystin-dependent protein
MDSILGEIRLFSFDFAPEGWMECAGQTLQVTQYTQLYSLIGNKYGGSGMTTFCLPNLGSIGQASGKVKYFIAVDGEFPPR